MCIRLQIDTRLFIVNDKDNFQDISSFVFDVFHKLMFCAWIVDECAEILVPMYNCPSEIVIHHDETNVQVHFPIVWIRYFEPVELLLSDL